MVSYCFTFNLTYFAVGTLTPDNAADMLDELLPAQNVTRAFGLKLKLPEHVVQAIHSTFSKPEERLLQILIDFTKQVDPRPTWRVVVDALKSPAVNLQVLARKVESDHFPGAVSARENVVHTTARK